jgi:hypothetical protein
LLVESVDNHESIAGCLGVWFKVAAKDSIDVGDRICLPITVREFPLEKQDCHCNEEEVNFVRSLVLYKVLDF